MKMDFLPYENTLSVRGAYEEWGGLLFARRVDDRLRYLFCTFVADLGWSAGRKP